ncbi:MAG: hypothetical protein AAFW59_02970 [Pseudomonadota bacterium]
MHPWRFLAALVLMTPAPVSLFAQETEAPEIIVSGERPLDTDAIRLAVRELAKAHRSDEPLLRFHDPVCLSVSGLGAAASAQVRERILKNARAADVAVADKGCRANALVLIVDDPASLIEGIQKDQPKLLSPAKRRPLDAALARGEKALVWHNEETRGAQGQALRTSFTAPGMPVTGPSSQLGAETRINNHGRARRVGATDSRAVVNGAVILNVENLVGMDLERVADFATMRLLVPGVRVVPDALAGVEEDGAVKPQSVLAPFSPDQGAERLTRFDRAWIEALYSLEPNASSTRLPAAVASAYENGSE